MIANVANRSASVPGCSARAKPTRIESTLGTGQNTWRLTLPLVFQRPYQAALALGAPYTFEPGGAASRSPTSACTITSPRCSVGKCSMKCRSTGTDTLYGRFATSTLGACGSSVMRRASCAITVRRLSRMTFGCIEPTVVGSCAANRLSISTATTCAPVSSNPRVREPRPGPTSTTTSVGSTPATFTMRRTVFGSMTKF